MESGGTGFQPVKEFRIYRRNLPHWEQSESVYFITFRTFRQVILTEESRDIIFLIASYFITIKNINYMLLSLCQTIFICYYSP